MSSTTFCGLKLIMYMAFAVLASNFGDTFSVEGLVPDISCHRNNVWIPFEEEFLFNVTTCDIPNCPNNCFCTLGNNTLLTSCYDGREEADTVVFPEAITTLYLGYIQLTSIQPFTFKGVANGWTELWLNNNNLSALQPGVFYGLQSLEFLTLYKNKLSEVRLGTFSGLDSLLELELKYNLLSSLQSGIFQELRSLENLALDYNRLVELQSGIFRGLINIEEIDADKNPIRKVSVDVFQGLKQMKELDLDGNMISELQTGVFEGMPILEELELDDNRLTEIPEGLFSGLIEIKGMSLSNNKLTRLDPHIFAGMVNLKELYLQNNKLQSLSAFLFRKATQLEILYLSHNDFKDLHPLLFQNLTNLKILSLSQTNLLVLPNQIFSDLHAIEFLNISRNNLNRISPELFHYLHSLVILDLTQNPLNWVNTRSFKALTKLVTVFVDEYATCCFINAARCSFTNHRSSFISCKRLLPYSILRVAIWIVGIATIIGNSLVLFKRFTQKTARVNVQTLLITNLSFSDLLTGIYLVILLSVDIHYMDFFPSHSETWRHSGLCKVAGALSLLSSENSVFLITLISIDRFMSIKFPFSAAKLSSKSAKIVVTVIWSFSGLLSILSVLISVFSPELYEASEICVGLPISRVNLYDRTEKSFELNTTSIEGDVNVAHTVNALFIGSKPSMFFSIAIFTVLNLICFLIVAFCYASIFYTAKRASRVRGTGNKDREIRRAFKMAAIVISDFCCWLVIIVLSILVQSKAITIKPEAYAWIATFILPINSCMNPFLYTLSTLISKRIERQIGVTTDSTSMSNPRSQQPPSGQ